MISAVSENIGTSLVIGGVGLLVVVAATLSRGSTAKDIEEKPLPVAPSGSKFIKLPKSGVTVRYTDTGSGKDGSSKGKQVTFLLLHGFAGVIETWEFLIPHLLEGNGKDTSIRAVALDAVGSGFSDKPNGDVFDYSYRNQGSVVSELISELGLSNVVLVGHSAGTVSGASTALENSKSGESTVVGSVFVANALFRPKSEFFSKPWLKPLFRWMTTKMMSNRKSSLEKMHSPIHAERVLTDDFVEKFSAPIRLPNFNDALVETVMAKEAPYEDLVDGLLALKNPVPLLFVFGEHDTYKPVPEEQKEKLDKKLGAMDEKAREQVQVETKHLKDCHHYAQHEQPEALAKEILDFVENKVTLK